MSAERNGTLLLVEDNPLDLDLTLRALKVVGVSNPVRVCTDGSEALDYVHERSKFAQNAPVPALVLLDLNLPKIDGVEVLRGMRAHARYRFVPIVILSTSEEERDLVAAYEGGANSYVVKAVSLDRFVEAIRQIGIYWLTVNRPVRH
jgi:two-component system response regulator